MADIAIFRINYKSDFILTLQSDAGWLTPFCIKFWTGAPSQAYFAGYDGTTYTHCAPVDGEPTKLLVQFDDHHLPLGDLKYQIAYHFTVADFPTSIEDEVINQAAVIIDNDGEQQQVMLDFNGETAPDIAFSLPAYANEAQRIANEQVRIAAEEQRVSNEQQRISNEEGRISAEERRQEHEQQRIHNEETRIAEFARLEADAIAATGAANDAATLANEKAQLASDKAALAQSAATLASDKAQLAADKAALAQAAATLANDKAALAQQKADYAQAKGDYAQAQGDYAKAQGDIALADHERAETDHERAEADHDTATDDHTTATSDHTQAESDHTRAEADHTTAASDHTQASSDHDRAESDHTKAGQDHDRAESDHTTAAADHTRAESDHAAVEVYVDSLGAFDISAYHATGSVLAKYADLTAALGTNGANIPDALRKGGMSVKFVLSSDNKYVQFRYMSSSTAVADFTNVANWQGVDSEPIAESKNLVESGGVYNSIGNKITEDFLIRKKIISKNLFNKNDEDLQKGGYLDAYNTWHVLGTAGESGYIPVLENKIYKWTSFGEVINTSWPYSPVCFYDCNKEFIRGTANPSALGYVVTPTNARYMRITFSLSLIDKLVISFGENVSSYIPYISPMQDSKFLNPSIGLYLPHNQIDFWDIVDYEQGIINNDGTLQLLSYRTLTYDISRFVGKEITIYNSATANNYSSLPVFVIVKDDESIVNYNDDTLPKKPYYPIVTIYQVQENDKYLKISTAYDDNIRGYVSLMLATDLNKENQQGVIIPPLLKPSASEVESALQQMIVQYCEYSNPQMFDKNAEGVVTNRYISRIAEGDVVWSNYNGINESDYISVNPGEKIYKTDFDQNDNVISTNWGYQAVCLFDENKNPISVIANPSARGYVIVPNNIYYIRFSYTNSNKIVISKNSNVTEYYEYLEPDYSIKDKIEDVNINLQEQIDKNEYDIEDINHDIEDINQRIADITGDGSQWMNKTWYAYGTSITSVVQGKYVPYLAAMSQMNVVNKGIAGGGIGDLGGYSHGQVRAAIMNTTDGKLNADLITLEVGANDTGADVPLGTIYDTDETTLCGCLNMCIRYLQQNTNAQIVIMPSPATIVVPSAEGKYYEAMWLFKQVCFINKCWWIDGMTNLGTAKIQRTDIRYVQDSIHQTELGGYVFAKAIWAELKKIPTFDITLPN